MILRSSCANSEQIKQMCRRLFLFVGIVQMFVCDQNCGTKRRGQKVPYYIWKLSLIRRWLVRALHYQHGVN